MKPTYKILYTQHTNRKTHLVNTHKHRNYLQINWQSSRQTIFLPKCPEAWLGWLTHAWIEHTVHGIPYTFSRITKHTQKAAVIEKKKEIHQTHSWKSYFTWNIHTIRNIHNLYIVTYIYSQYEIKDKSRITRRNCTYT